MGAAWQIIRQVFIWTGKNWAALAAGYAAGDLINTATQDRPGPPTMTKPEPPPGSPIPGTREESWVVKKLKEFFPTLELLPKWLVPGIAIILLFTLYRFLNNRK